MEALNALLKALESLPSPREDKASLCCGSPKPRLELEALGSGLCRLSVRSVSHEIVFAETFQANSVNLESALGGAMASCAAIAID